MLLHLHAHDAYPSQRWVVVNVKNDITWPHGQLMGYLHLGTSQFLAQAVRVLHRLRTTRKILLVRRRKEPSSDGWPAGPASRLSDLRIK